MLGLLIHGGWNLRMLGMYQKGVTLDMQDCSDILILRFDVDQGILRIYFVIVHVVENKWHK